MDPNHYSESCHPIFNGLGPLQLHVVNFAFEQPQLFNQHPHNLASHHYSPGMLPTRYATGYNAIGIFPVQDDSPKHPIDHSSFVYANRPSLPIQAQDTYLSHEDKAIQTTKSDLTTKRDDKRERSRAHQRPTPRDPVHQETYRSPRHHAEFVGSKYIEFIVDGEEGIRLSNVLEGKWAGFEGWDDRSLFGGGRLQIMIRLHFPGCSPWESKISTTDFTVKRRPITRMKLATEVAKRMKKFIAREILNGHGHGHSQCNWGDVSLENVFLTRMVRVSAASWQPQFSVE